MNKRQTRKFPFRNRLINDLRKIKNPHYTIIDSMGHEIILNLAKHYLLNKPYKNKEYQRELLRKISDFRK